MNASNEIEAGSTALKKQPSLLDIGQTLPSE